FAGFIMGSGFVDIFDDVNEDVESNNVGSAEGRGLGPADGGARAGVDFFDGHIERLHQAQGVEHGKSADAICDKVWSVFRGNDTLAEAVITKFGESGKNFRKSFGAGNNFDQL